MSRMKWIFSTCLTGLICLFCLLFASAESTEGLFSIRTENELFSDSGLSAQAWEDEVLLQTEAGLASPITKENLQILSPHAECFHEGSSMCMLQALENVASIQGPMDAYRTVHRLLPILSDQAGLRLRLRSRLTLGKQTSYCFQQISEGYTVSSSSVKLIVDSTGNLTAVFSSLSKEPHADTVFKGISANEAEDVVRSYLANRNVTGEVMPEYTACTVIPDEHCETDESLQDRLVWMVYSGNPHFADDRLSTLPYMAHMIGMDGTYLYHLCISSMENPGVHAGYTAAYAFRHLESYEWTGTVLDGNGHPVSLTVPVMYDRRTGLWFLADARRKIAVADYYQLAHGNEEVAFLAQQDNQNWDDEDLLTYANMIRTWDFFAHLGWNGPDGSGAPILLLRNMCDMYGNSIANAAYCGPCQGWQCFAYGGNEYIGACLDVMAHEYAHCMTDTLMNTNLDRNDMGAINESISDILGNLCEMISDPSRERNWLIAEDLGYAFRSMLHPHDYEQPEYIWDLYYVPASASPGDLNDRGGVHSNSSLLNYLAAHLCEDYGMDLNDALAFWMQTAFVLTPTIDFPALSHLLPWALSASGHSDSQIGLNTLIANTRLSETLPPVPLPEGRNLVHLKLPDTPAFTQRSWIMVAIQLNSDLFSQNTQSFLDLAEDLTAHDSESDAADLLFSAIHLDADTPALLSGHPFSLLDWLTLLADQHASAFTSWAPDPGSELMTVLENRPTVYLLLSLSEETEDVAGGAVLLENEWKDLYDLMPSDSDDAFGSTELFTLFGRVLKEFIHSMQDQTSSSQNICLSEAGLDSILLHTIEEDDLNGLPEDDFNSVGLLPRFSWQK